MAHEQGETVGGGGEPIRNVYGSKTPQAGKPLPPMFSFERSVYETIPQAVQADVLRSMLTNLPGMRMSGSDYLRSNPTAELVQQLLILWQMQQQGQGAGRP